MKPVCGAARLMKCLSVFKKHKFISLKIVPNEPKVLSLPLSSIQCRLCKESGVLVLFYPSHFKALAKYRGHGEREKHSQIKRERERSVCVGGEWRCHLSQFPGREVTPLITSLLAGTSAVGKTGLCDTHCPLAFSIYLTYTLDKKERKEKSLRRLKHVNQTGFVQIL